MPATVFANMMAVSCKAGDGKSICAMPDVCLTPPAPPAGPIPIPYPNTGMATDTDGGSKEVKINDKEVMLKDKSSFKKSTGDEAATSGQGANVITHKIQGKCFFKAWSMDVKVEGENVVRHFDIMTHNHASDPPGTPPWPYADTMNPDTGVDPCEKDKERTKSDCADSPISEPRSCSEACQKAMECTLVPKGKDKKYCCAPDNTGDHVIEDHWVRPGGTPAPDFASIDNLYHGAPTMCVNRSRYSGKHGIAHGTRGFYEDQMIGQQFPYSKAKEMGCEAHADANPTAECSKDCVEAQLDSFYGKDGNKQCQASKQRQPLKDEQRVATRKRKADQIAPEGD